MVKSELEPESNLAEAPVTISVDKKFKDPEKNATTELTVPEYKTTKASQNPRTTKAVYTYSPEGNLTGYVEYIQYTDIEKGLLWGKNGLSGSNTYVVNENGEKMILYQNGYTVDDKGQIITDDAHAVSGKWTRTIYTRRSDGQGNTAELYVLNHNNDEYVLVSTASYQYSENGNLISSSLAYAGDSSKAAKTSYINNTNGSPVKITTRNTKGKLVSTEERGYNDDGTIAFSNTYDSSGDQLYRTWYYYDKDGYLEKSVDFDTGTDGNLKISSISTYEYFGW